MQMIIARQLVKKFGARCAVDGIDLCIASGETFGLLGPNGAGKTTAIHLLVGLLKPDSGTAEISGRDPMSPQARRVVGVAPQSLSLYEELTATENLRFFGRLYGLRRQVLNERLNWALELAGLADRAKDRVQTFSGGMKRRLNIAVGLIHRPLVLFLDEPTVGVDPQSRNHILECIGKLAAEGLTVVYTTHYMEEAQKICNRVAIMDHGKLLAVDSVPQLIANYGGRSVIQAQLQENSQRSNLPGTLDNDDLRFECVAPIEELARLYEQGVRFNEVRISQPDLESVFLALTGRSLRD